MHARSGNVTEAEGVVNRVPARAVPSLVASTVQAYYQVLREYDVYTVITMNRMRIASLGAALSLSLLGAALSPHQADAQRRVAPDSLRHIQEVAPLHGPPGTEVTVYTENLPLQAKVHLGVGATRTGFEALFEAEQGMWGEISGTIRIPETAPWDRAVLLVAFDAIFAPIGFSEPFHVTRPDGILQRTGEVTDEGVECLAMRDTDGYLYTLIGATDGLQAGAPVVLQGRYVEVSTCNQGTTIEVVEVLPPSTTGR